MTISSSKDDPDKNFQPGKILMSAIRFNEELFKESILPYIRHQGIEEAYVRYLHPLIEKARILWQTGSLSRAQEQFIRNTITQLIIIEDSLLKPSAGKSRPVVAMINTSDNMFDNNFLFYKYVLKKRGFDVIFTGGILPASEAVEIYKIKSFDYLVVNSNAFDFARKKIEYFNNIGKSLMIKKIILTDSPEAADKKYYDKLILTSDPAGFIRCIEGFYDHHVSWLITLSVFSGNSASQQRDRLKVSSFQH